ncbi:MAG: MFS transporter [Woeseiaceae bacterium]|nr:MFS transporter [Woeseiaceae bacterium]
MTAKNGEQISLGLLVVLTSCWFLAQMGYYAQAQLFGPVMERYGLDEAAVGLMMSKEVMAYALTALLLAGPVTRYPRARIALLGGAIVFVCNVIAGYTDNFEVLRFARLAAGFGAGMIGAAGTAAAASTANPQRVFAIVAVSWGVVAAIPPILIPYATVPFGAMGGYFGLAAAVLLIAPLFYWLPDPPRDDQPDTDAETKLAGLSAMQRFAERLGIRNAPNKGFAIAALVALFIYEMGQGSIQVFLEQFGLRGGLNEIRIGEILGIAGFVGLSGGIVAAWLADRFGNLRPALIGIALNVVVAASLALWTHSLAFAVLYVCWNATFYFVVPYILGIMAEMDRKGRWAVATDAVWWMGAAPGPAIGGYVVAGAGYPGLAGLVVALGIIAMIIFRITLGRFYATRSR